jgi:hypothetical protein
MKNQTSKTEDNSSTDGQTSQVKTMDVFGYKIESNSCKAVDYNLYVKKFGEYVVRSGAEHGFVLTMNHIQLWELIDEATSIELKEEADNYQKWLIVETKDFRVSVRIPSEDN